MRLDEADNIEGKIGRYFLEWKNGDQDKVYIFVEDRYDQTLFIKFFNPDKISFKCLGTCRDMKTITDGLSVKKVLCIGIKDNDFDRLTNRLPNTDNLFLTDFHDHEMMCLSEDGVLQALFSCFAFVVNKDIISEVFNKLYTLSLLKWMNYENRLSLNFKVLKLREMNKNQLSDFNLINGLISQKSQNAKNITYDDFKSFCESKQNTLRSMDENKMYYEITNGHDFLYLLHDMIFEERKNINKVNGHETFSFIKISDNNLLHIVHSAYNLECFKKTNLYSSIKEWSLNNNISILL